MSRSTLSCLVVAATAVLSATSHADPAVGTDPQPPAAEVKPPEPPNADAVAQAVDQNADQTKADQTKAEPPKTDQAQAKKVAALEGPPPDEVRVDTISAPHHQGPQPTPRFELAGGAFVQSRGLDFDYDPYADGGPPSYPASNIMGFELSGAVYPLPLQRYDGRMSGIGFSFKVAKSTGATIVASDDTGTGEYEVDHSMYEAGLHYRYPVDQFAIDGELAYGNWSHTIVDLPESIQIPDTSYQYISAGAHVDIFPTQRSSIGFGAKYLHIMSTGDVSSQDWYGAGDAAGVVLDADFTIPLPSSLFLRGGLEYRRIWIDFDGSGDLSDYWGVGTMTDTSITGSAQIGVQF